MDPNSPSVQNMVKYQVSSPNVQFEPDSILSHRVNVPGLSNNPNLHRNNMLPAAHQSIAQSANMMNQRRNPSSGAWRDKIRTFEMQMKLNQQMPQGHQGAGRHSAQVVNYNNNNNIIAAENGNLFLGGQQQPLHFKQKGTVRNNNNGQIQSPQQQYSTNDPSERAFYQVGNTSMGLHKSSLAQGMQNVNMAHGVSNNSNMPVEIGGQQLKTQLNDGRQGLVLYHDYSQMKQNQPHRISNEPLFLNATSPNAPIEMINQGNQNNNFVMDPKGNQKQYVHKISTNPSCQTLPIEPVHNTQRGSSQLKHQQPSNFKVPTPTKTVGSLITSAMKTPSLSLHTSEINMNQPYLYVISQTQPQNMSNGQYLTQPVGVGGIDNSGLQDRTKFLVPANLDQIKQDLSSHQIIALTPSKRSQLKQHMTDEGQASTQNRPKPSNKQLSNTQDRRKSTSLPKRQIRSQSSSSSTRTGSDDSEGSNVDSDSGEEELDLRKDVKRSGLGGGTGKKDYVTMDEMRERKFISMERWFCVSRPQYAKSCGISSLVACFNYLFSNLGGQGGTKSLVTQEQAMLILGYRPPFDDIRFEKWANNKKMFYWWARLCKHFNVRSECRYLYKPRGKKNVTHHMTAETACKALKKGLQSGKKAYIYHCYKHFMLPVGFEEVPVNKSEVFKRGIETETTIIVADNSRKSKTFHCLPWDIIVQDLTLQQPNYVNVRKLEEGFQVRQKGQRPSTSHCIMEFIAVNPLHISKKEAQRNEENGNESKRGGQKTDR